MVALFFLFAFSLPSISAGYNKVASEAVARLLGLANTVPLTIAEIQEFDTFITNYISYRGKTDSPQNEFPDYNPRVRYMATFKLTNKGDDVKFPVEFKKMGEVTIIDLAVGGAQIPNVTPEGVTVTGPLEDFLYSKSSIAYDVKKYSSYHFEAVREFLKIWNYGNIKAAAESQLSKPNTKKVLVGQAMFVGNYKGTLFGDYMLVPIAIV